MALPTVGKFVDRLAGPFSNGRARRSGREVRETRGVFAARRDGADGDRQRL